MNSTFCPTPPSLSNPFPSQFLSQLTTSSLHRLVGNSLHLFLAGKSVSYLLRRVLTSSLLNFYISRLLAIPQIHTQILNAVVTSSLPSLSSARNTPSSSSRRPSTVAAAAASRPATAAAVISGAAVARLLQPRLFCSDRETSAMAVPDSLSLYSLIALGCSKS